MAVGADPKVLLGLRVLQVHIPFQELNLLSLVGVNLLQMIIFLLETSDIIIGETLVVIVIALERPQAAGVVIQLLHKDAFLLLDLAQLLPQLLLLLGHLLVLGLKGGFQGVDFFLVVIKVLVEVADFIAFGIVEHFLLHPFIEEVLVLVFGIIHLANEVFPFIRHDPHCLLELLDLDVAELVEALEAVAGLHLVLGEPQPEPPRPREVLPRADRTHLLQPIVELLQLLYLHLRQRNILLHLTDHPLGELAGIVVITFQLLLDGLEHVLELD
mmetsp:Transcript_28319/g.27251  ORF Transcript_28319/g.27251 Transcript_28319/m.27251 type:complete len:271 (-) Transcript_28319:274-1086(-)